jgi:uncharacterized protein (TIGR02270 family)
MAAVVASASPASRSRFIPGLLTVHAEELEYLWGRRRSTSTSPNFTLRHLNELNERIEAHLQGLLVAGDGLAGLMMPRLTDEDRDSVFVGAFALLRSLKRDHVREVVEAFRTASGPALAGLSDALALASIAPCEQDLCGCLNGPDGERAAASALVLACHGRLDPTSPKLTKLLSDPDPVVARAAWRAVQLVEPASAATRPYPEAFKSKDAGIRDAALGAAVWRGERWVPDVARTLAEAGDAVATQWLAAIGGAEAAPLMRQILAQPQRTPEMIRAAGRFGHPDMIEPLLDAMAAEDPKVAAIAGEVFTRIVGFAVEGHRETLQVAKDADQFEREFAEEVWLPDAVQARQLWERYGQTWRAGLRWCRGCEVSSRLTKNAQARIDLQGFWDFGARAALAGRRVFGPASVAL